MTKGSGFFITVAWGLIGWSFWLEPAIFILFLGWWSSNISKSLIIHLPSERNQKIMDSSRFKEWEQKDKIMNSAEFKKWEKEES